MTVVKGISVGGFYIVLCIVIFVFLPGSEKIKVRLYKGVVVNPLHVKKLCALLNLSTVIHEHGYFSKSPIDSSAECLREICG